MAELQRLLQQNGTFKSDLMQKFLSAAKVSFQEHQRQGNNNHKGKPAKDSHEERSFSSPNSNNSPSSLTELSPTNNRNVNNKLIDNKEGIYETIDNYQYSQGANVIKMDNETGTNTQLYTDIKQDQFLPETNVIQMDNETGGNSPLYTEIKQEPDLDNKTLSMMSDYSTSTMSSLEGSPLIMPDMSPDTLMDNNNMMEGMMGGLMGGMMEGMMSGKMPEMPPMMPEMTFPEPDQNANEIDVDRIMEEVKQVPSDLRRDLMEQVIETVGNAHMQTVRPTYKTIAEANQRFEQMIAEGNMPDMAKLSLNPTVMWQEFIQSMVLEITNVVRFCKKLPGFGEIAQEDQIIMIKKGAFEVLVVRMCMLVDHVKGEMFDPNMKMKCPRAMVKGMPMGFFMEEFFSVAEQLNPLEMTDKERGMFSAMLMMCPDREGLSNKIAIEKLNSLFNQSMFVMMKRQHADFENKFARLVGIIPLFHRINKKHSMALNSLRMHKAEIVKDMPQLTKEIWDIDQEDN